MFLFIYFFSPNESFSFFRNNGHAVSLRTCSQNTVLALWICSHRAGGDQFNRVFSKMPEIQNRQTNQQVSVPKMTICSTTRKPVVSSCVLWLRRSKGEMQREALFMSWCSRLSRCPVCHLSVCDNRDRLERDSTSIPLGWDRLILPETCVLAWLCVCVHWVYIYLFAHK